MSPGLCIAAGGVVASLAMPRFTLWWEHSIEHTQWRETWTVEDTVLVPREGRIRGFGAGMEDPPEGGRLENGWIVHVPELPPQSSLTFPDSDFVKPMHLCPGDDNPCPRTLRSYLPDTVSHEEPVTLSACPLR